ncbi:hypothetical protein TFLX_05176 [Thermoflexales bacterium]|nr:hypothetical protein TFLX_05176 [Thermoflexales bacterium]
MKRNQYLDDMAKFVGLVVIALVVGGLLFGLIYGLIGNLSERGIHLLATALVFGLLGAFLLGLQVGKAHVKGVERGLDLKIGARERTQPTARPTGTPPTPAQRFDDLLPTVKRAVIVTRQDDDTTPIEL